MTFPVPFSFQVQKRCPFKNHSKLTKDCVDWQFFFNWQYLTKTHLTYHSNDIMYLLLSSKVSLSFNGQRDETNKAGAASGP